MIKVEVVLEEEQVQDIFESAEVRFSKAKMKKLKELADDADIDIKERLEEALTDFLEEIIADEWGE